MSKTLQLSRYCALFVDDKFLYIKLSKPSPNFGKQDFYILKKFDLSVLKKVRDWADVNLSNTQTQQPTQEMTHG